jgi:predicted amidohydrolase
MWISIGGWHEHVPKDMERMRNTHTIINDKGDIVANYHKVHMFDVNIEGRLSLMESKYTAPGNHIRPPVATPAGALGLGTVCVLAHVDHQNSIQCYDMRFSAHGARLRELGADILTFPSAFTKPTGEAGHWHTLLRARAIETQCYVIAAAQFG